MRLVLDELDQNLRYTQRLPVSFPRPGVSFLISIEAVALLKSLLPWRILIVHPGKNSNSSGVGISLSVEDGGHPYLLKEIFRPRLELKLADFTTLRLGLDATLQPFPFHFYGQTFDLVLLAAHHLPADNCCLGHHHHEALPT
jgi:hypothetical protein